MALRFCSFASGSSGNCYLVKSEETAVLIDVGIAGKHILAGLEGKGLSAEQLDGILLTHEHIDHVKSLKMMAKKAEHAKVFGSAGTLMAAGDKVKPGQGVSVFAGETFAVGDMQITPFRLSHDAAEPLGYSVSCGGKQLTLVTDTGCISEEIFAEILRADLLILEANHEVNILQMGAYPYSLKRRILGDEGHLSNETAGRCLCEMLKARAADRSEQTPKVVLAHLSKENNTPGQAYLTIRNLLNEEDFYPDKDLTIEIAARDEAGEYIEV